MFQMKYEDVAKFMNQDGGSLIHKLSNLQVPLKVTYGIKKVTNLVFKQFKVVQNEYLELCKPFAKCVDGVAMDPLPGVQWWDESKQEEMEKSEKAFNQRIAEIDWVKIKFSDIENLKFSAAELEILESVVEFPADLETPKGLA